MIRLSLSIFFGLVVIAPFSEPSDSCDDRYDCPSYPKDDDYPFWPPPPPPPPDPLPGRSTLSPYPGTEPDPAPEPNPFGPRIATCNPLSQTVLDQIIIWPSTPAGQKAVSSPLCLDETLKPITRQCDGESLNDGWSDAPTCHSVQQSINPCPSDLTAKEDGRYCYTVVEKTVYPPECPYPGALDWDVYVNWDLFDGKPFWMPYERNDDEETGIDLFRYSERTFKYKSSFQVCTQSCRTFFYEGSFLDKKCLIYHNSSHVEAVSCDRQYSAMCAYEALPYRQASSCGQTYRMCKQMSYDPLLGCFCETTNSNIGEQVLAEFLEPYQNLLFTDKMCRLGLQNIKSNTSVSFEWTVSQTPINYTNWAQDVNFTNKYGVITDQGWSLVESSDVDCSIYRVDAPPTSGSLRLEIEGDIFKLRIRNYRNFLMADDRPIVYCFTDADAKSLITPVQHADVEVPAGSSTFIFEVLPIRVDQSGPGNYWCEAFLYADLRPIVSNWKLNDSFVAEYVVLFRLRNYVEKLSPFPLTAENVETLQNLFRNELPNDVTFYPRFYKINAIDETAKEMNVTFHLTSAEARNTTEEFEALKGLTMRQSMFEFLEFRSVHYCIESNTEYEGQQIAWPRTAYGESTRPVGGYCATHQAHLVERSCVGSFVDGAYWADLESECQFFAESSLTEQIISIGQRTGDEDFEQALAELQEVTREIATFNTLDFVLASHFLRDIADKSVDLGVLAEIVNNLMQMHRAVLLSAQLNFKSTDVLLKAVDCLLEKGDFGEWKEANFAIKSVDVSQGIVGFQLQNCVNHTDCDFVAVNDSRQLYNETFVGSESIEAAVSLSSDLYSQIVEYATSNVSYSPKLVVAVYYGSQLFVELQNIRYSNLVVGVLLPGFDGPFRGPVSIFYYGDSIQSDLLVYNCSYWRFDSSRNSQWTVEKPVKSQGALACHFSHLTHFGVPALGDTCEPSSNTCSDRRSPCTLVDLIPSDFCVATNNLLVPVECFENFSDPSFAEDIAAGCVTFEMSSNTKELLYTAPENDDTSDSVLDTLLSMTAKSDTITNVDLLVVASFLKVIANKTVDMQKVVEVINNTMEIPDTVIMESQLSFKTLDILLMTVEQMVNKAPCGEWSSVNFVIKCINLTNHTGFMLSNCSQKGRKVSDCVIVPLKDTDNQTMEDSSVYAVVSVADLLRGQLLHLSRTNTSYNPMLMASIYYNSKLFVDTMIYASNNSVSNVVFGLLLPEFRYPFQGPITIHYANNVSWLQYNCSYWKFEDTFYGHWITENTLLGGEGTGCHFYHLTNFLIPFDERGISYDDPFQIVSSSMDNWTGNGSMLDYNLCHQVLNSDDGCLSLEHLAGIVEGCMGTPTQIDRLLETFTNDTREVSKENVVFVSVSSVDARYFQGLLVAKDRQLQCLYGTEASFDADADVSIALHPELRRQIAEARSGLIVALFYSEALFSTASGRPQLPVVEILLPGVHQRLRGPITITYHRADGGKCCYWDVDESRWIEESYPEFEGSVMATCRFQHVTHFALVATSQNITTDLEHILASNLTGMEKLKQVDSITTLNHNNLVPVDIFLISQIIAASLSEGAIPKVISNIISSLFRVPRHVLRQSQTAHSATDIILYTVDEMVSLLNEVDIQKRNFSLIVKNLKTSNLTGLLVYDCTEFTCKIEQLTQYVNVSHFAGNKSISAMVLFDEQLVGEIRRYIAQPKVAVSMFYSDVLFNEVNLVRETTKIFGIVFPGLASQQLNGSISVVYNVANVDRRECVYWHYKADPTGNVQNATLGGWTNDSSDKQLMENLMSICQYSHVTHFGMLLSNNNDFDDDPVLELVTDIGCMLSLFGVSVILFTGTFFKKWRQNTGNKILMNFSVAISLKIVMLYVSEYMKNTKYGLKCTITGAVLHYAILSECAWMLTIAILQFKRFVEVLGGRPKYVLIKALICGWIFPVIPVMCVLLIDHDNYVKGMANLCYPSDLGLYLGVWLPVLIILSLNCVIFVLIIVNVFRKKTEYIDNSNNDVLFQWRLVLLLFFMLGLNWIFGFLGQIRGDGLFIYLYSITASLQGFVMFLFFIVFNNNTKCLYVQAVKQWFYARGYFNVAKSKEKTTSKN